MNKKIILFLTALLAFAACQKLEPNAVAGESIVLSAQIEQGDLTKTALGSDKKVIWSENDHIMAFMKSSAGNQYSILPEFAGKTYADFSGNSLAMGSDWEHIVAYYPYSSTVKCSKSGSDYIIDAVIPAEQAYTQSSFANGSFPMVAVSTDNKLAFKNVCGGIKLQLKGSANVASIKIEGRNNEKLSGAAKITAKGNGELPSIAMDASASATATLKCSPSVKLNSNTATEFIISLPPVEFTKGFTITVTDTENNTYTVKTSRKNTVVRSSLLAMPEKTIVKDAEPRVGKARMVWIDAAANFEDYANNSEKIATDMAKIKATGFTGVIVDVRPRNSGVLFKSSTEHALTRVDDWEGSNYRWLQRTASFDYLQAFIDAGKKEGLDVYASINTMVGGCLCPYGLGKDGFLYDDASKKSWASVVNTSSGLVNCLDLDDSGAKFLNPANDEVVNYLLNLLADLAAYDLDGIILDRCRYDDYGLGSDFSDISRSKFEAHIGAKVSNWPSDIFAPGTQQLSTSATYMQKKWMEFRAKTIHDFIEKAADKVHSVNSDILFGAYVGAWYSSYYTTGANWASPKYETSWYYSNWATADYNEYGFADHCDIMIIGAYAASTSIWGSGEWSMQGFCKNAQTLFAGDVPFIGGPDIGNSSGFVNGGQGSIMPNIVDACINASTEGMFFFDLCHIKMYDYWADIKKAFDQYLATVK